MIIDSDRITWQHADAELHRRLLESAKRNPPGREWFADEEMDEDAPWWRMLLEKKTKYRLTPKADEMTPEHTHCRDCGVCDGDTHMTGCPTWNTQRIELTIKLDAGNLERLAGRVIGLLRKVLEGQRNMSAELQALSDKVTAQTSVIGSATTLLGSLADQIRALRNDPVALAALADQLSANTAALATAVEANTTP